MSDNMSFLSVGSVDAVLARLLRPNRDGITFQMPNRPEIPVLATLEVKIPISTSSEGIRETIFAYLIRTHTVELNPKTGSLARIRPNSKGGGYQYMLVPNPNAVYCPDLNNIDYEINSSNCHKANCRETTTLNPSARGKCFCDIDSEFKPQEVLEAFENFRQELLRNSRQRRA